MIIREYGVFGGFDGDRFEVWVVFFEDVCDVGDGFVCFYICDDGVDVFVVVFLDFFGGVEDVCFGVCGVIELLEYYGVVGFIDELLCVFYGFLYFECVGCEFELCVECV